MSRYNVATRPGRLHDTAQEACDTVEGTQHGAQCAQGKGQAYDTADHRLRHDPRHGRDTAVLGIVRAACAGSLGLGCAPGAPNPVLTQCTVLSHCLGHCS